MNRRFGLEVLILMLFSSIGITRSGSIDWCEYWAKVGKKNERPECVGYELPLRRPETTIQCPKNQVYTCVDCEPTCHNLVPKCRKVRKEAVVFTIRGTRVQRSVEEQCNRGCVCRNGLARSSSGECIQFRECVNHYPAKTDAIKTEEEGTVMKTVKKIVPVIVNDVWKAFFNSIRVQDNKTTTRTVDFQSMVVDFTTLPPTEIKDEKIINH